jgi:hypothetical protein
MPNGISGGFALDKEALERILLALPSDSIVAWFSRTKPPDRTPITTEILQQILSEAVETILPVQENKSRSYYVIRLPDRMMLVSEDSDLYRKLRSHHTKPGGLCDFDKAGFERLVSSLQPRAVVASFMTGGGTREQVFVSPLELIQIIRDHAPARVGVIEDCGSVYYLPLRNFVWVEPRSPLFPELRRRHTERGNAF